MKYILAMMLAASASAADYGDILQSIRITGAYSKTITNVVAEDNHRGCATCDGMAKYGWALYHPPHEGGGAYVGPTEKWEITTVENVSVLIFNWLGKPRSIEDREVVSRTTNRWTLESEWKPSTNSPAQSQTVTLTNRLSGDYHLQAFGPVITVLTNGLTLP